MTEQTPSKPWYRKWWGVVLTVLLFPFVVPYLVWTKTTWNKWVKIGITIFCLAFIVRSNTTNTIKTKDTGIPTTSKNTEDTTNNSTTIIEPTKQTKVIRRAVLSGIDTESGELAVPSINIFENHGDRGNNTSTVIGKLPHGTEIEIIEEKSVGQDYMAKDYKIRSSLLRKDGWVNEIFVTDSLPTAKPQRERTNTKTNNPTSTDGVTLSQRNAVAKAKSYLNYTAFSYQGLVKQLEYEQFSNADAIYGVDNCGADWNEQAVKKAKSYMDYSAYSRGGLIDQLIYEGFTQEQAEYGVNAVGL